MPGEPERRASSGDGSDDERAQLNTPDLAVENTNVLNRIRFYTSEEGQTSVKSWKR